MIAGKAKFLLAYLSLLLMLSTTAFKCVKSPKGCTVDYHAGLTVRNNSAKPVYYQEGQAGTIYQMNGSVPSPDPDQLLAAGSSKNLAVRDCWEARYKNGYSNYFLFYDNDTVQSIGWQGVNGTRRGLLGWVKVDSVYLQQNSFLVTYQ